MEEQDVIVKNAELSVRADTPLPVTAPEPLTVTGVVRTVSATDRYTYEVRIIGGDDKAHEVNLVRYLQERTSEGWEPVHIIHVPPYSYESTHQPNFSYRTQLASNKDAFVVVLRRQKTS